MTDKQKPNDRCSCGSGKKYKRCCGGVIETPPIETDPLEVEKLFKPTAALTVMMAAALLNKDGK